MALKSRCNLVFPLASVLLAACRGQANSGTVNAWNFSRGQFPITIEEGSLRIRAEDRQLKGTNRECGACHEVAYKNWASSRHRVAFTNELYHESHAREPSAWCLNCHAPFLRSGDNVLDAKRRVQSEDGVSCNVCHVRNNRVVVARLPAIRGTSAAHDYWVEPGLAESRFCESCHEFPFPSADSHATAGNHMRFSDLLMQSTYSEWLASGFNKTTCQGCHLFSRSNASHRFPGGHDTQMLNQALKIEGRRNHDGRLSLQVFSLGIGHAFPTGDLFRTLKLALYNKSKFVAELTFGKEFQNQRLGADELHRPNKFLSRDTTIPAPLKGEFVSVKDQLVDRPAGSTQVTYELRLEYLHPHNALVSRLPESVTSTVIRRGKLQIKAATAVPGKG